MRSSHGGFGVSNVSVQSSTMSATSRPNLRSILLSVLRPPWSSAASCSSAAIACVSRARVLEHGPGDAQEVADVGNAGRLLDLVGVQIERIDERLAEFL